jgi:hypothetical protein
MRFVVSHPSRKNKNAVRVGHPEIPILTQRFLFSPNNFYTFATAQSISAVKSKGR